jgi:hypothetical protein
MGLSDAVFFMIPKRAFPDEALIRDFRALTMARIPRR